MSVIPSYVSPKELLSVNMQLQAYQKKSFQISVYSQINHLVGDVGVYGDGFIEVFGSTPCSIVCDSNERCVTRLDRLAQEIYFCTMARCPGIKDDQQALALVHKLEIEGINRAFHPDFSKMVYGIHEFNAAKTYRIGILLMRLLVAGG